jgi:hypothetical protein
MVNLKRKQQLLSLLLLAGAVLGLFLFAAQEPATAFAQQPTGSVPTVTGTPPGPSVTVYADRNIIEVYAGPSSYLYPAIGILVAGETAPALGYSIDGEWIQIVYPGVRDHVGWVYAPLVSLNSVRPLGVIKSPPTATPRTTPTLDPTLVALYGVQQTVEKLPTFTQPPALAIPTFDQGSERRGLPVGLVILVIALIGILGAFVSFQQGNR